MSEYDPFAPGKFSVTERSFEAHDAARGRRFPISVWRPDRNDRPFPLILYSHAALQHRRVATFLTTHLCSHGYVVAAMDHSETVMPELGRQSGESEEQKQARWKAVIDSRVPDIRFLLDTILASETVDAARIGLVGHSFGGWTALACPDAEPRIRAVVALAPAGASQRRPGILPVTLAFDWRRDVPTLIIAAENDTSLPLAGMIEIFERTPATREMVILKRADHMHFIDEIEATHERFRTAPVSPELAEMQREMLPMAQLTSGEVAHLFVRGLTLAHFDAVLKKNDAARRFLDDLQRELTSRGIDAIVHRT